MAAPVVPIRQRTQYTCGAASLSMALKALGVTLCDEDKVNEVMGAAPMQGASWEQIAAAANHYGCRSTLVVPSTLAQVKGWTDAGKPVLIGWNPEDRPWSHASLVFDVTDTTVFVADPNCPDPSQTVREVPIADFYKKWSEEWNGYKVRRPAMLIDREVDSDGRQVMASKKAKVINKFWVVRDPTADSELADILYEANTITLAQLVLGTGLLDWKNERTTIHDDKASAEKDAKERLAKMGKKASTLTQPLSLRYDYGYKKDLTMDTSRLPEDVAITASGDPWKDTAKKLLDARKGTGQDDLHYRAYLRAIISGQNPSHLTKQFDGAKEAMRDLIDERGKLKTASEHDADSDGSYMSVGYLKALADKSKHLLDYISYDTPMPDWAEAKIGQAANAINSVHDYFVYRGDEGGEMKLEDQYTLLPQSVTAKFEEGKSVDVPKYLEEHGNPEAAKEWVEQNEANRDKFKTASSPVARRVSDLLPFDYNKLIVSAATGKKTPSGMDVWDNRTIEVPDPVTPDLIESIMLSAHRKYPKAMVKLYGQRKGAVRSDSLLMWTSARGFGVPDYMWEKNNLGVPTRGEVAAWIAGRGPNPNVGDDQVKTAGVVVKVVPTKNPKPTFRGAANKQAVGDIPADVERYVKEIKESNPDYDEAQVWATAWSIYCKYKNPDSDHCTMPASDYFAGRSAADEGLEAAWGETMADWSEGHVITPAVSGPDTPFTEQWGSDTPDGFGNIAKRAANHGKANAEFLNKIDAGAKDKILKNIAKHYDISPKEALAEVTDADAESLLDYMVEPERSAAAVMMKKYKSASADAEVAAILAEMDLEAKFEKGKPADPTENMSPADAAEWNKQKEEHKDQFKSARQRLSWNRKAGLDEACWEGYEAVGMKELDGKQVPNCVPTKQASMPSTVQGWLEWED